jgi:hypothetical protein
VTVNADPSLKARTETIDEVIDRYQPQELRSENRDAVLVFTRAVVRAAAPSTSSQARHLLRNVARMSDWYLTEHPAASLTTDVLLDPAMVERFVTEGLAKSSNAVRSVARAMLRRASREAAPHLHSPSMVIARPSANAPYSDEDLRLLLAHAERAPGKWKAELDALICLGAGSPLQPGEHSAVRGSDVRLVDGVVVVDVRGSAPRTVPVDEPYGQRLLRRSRRAGHDYVAGSVASRKSALRWMNSQVDVPRLEVGRLRATWLTRAVRRLGFDALLAAMAVRRTPSVFDAVEFLDEVDDNRILTVLGHQN